MSELAKPPRTAAEFLAETDLERAPPETRSPGPLPPEVDGAKGPEPTRFGDWERKGRCTDF